MPWPKIARLSRNCVISEKLDGTNAQVFIWNSAENGEPPENIPYIYEMFDIHIAAGSQTKWITPGDDNFGFASWVLKNGHEIAKIGHGRHFGEWWGQGIQRKYNLTERRFSLFDLRRFCLHGHEPQPIQNGNPKAEVKYQQPLPKCVGLVPLLYSGEFSTVMADKMLESLSKHGSQAAPGFMNPEGIVVFHEASQVCFKKTIEDDANPKST